jgi:hypothetical protein
MPEKLDRTQGVIIHLPAGEGTCSVHYIDLVKGWKAAGVASWVKRDWQKDKGLLSPVVRIAPPVPSPPSAPVEHDASVEKEPVQLNADLYVRINALTDEQRAELKARWPKGVNLKRNVTLNQRFEIAALISAIEQPAVVKEPPNEGRAADPDTVKTLRSMAAALPPDGGGAQWMTRTIRGCELAGAPISVTEVASLRRFELCRALYLLAANKMTDRFDDMVRATVGDVPGDTVALLASMNVDEATQFALHVTALVAGVEVATAQPITAA